MRWVVVMLLLLVACDESRAGKPAGASAAPTASGTVSASPAEAQRWPELPRDAESLRAVVRAHTRRAVTADDAPDAEQIREALRRGADSGQIYGGFEAISRELQRRLDQNKSGKRVYLLFGSHHDAAGQIDAFRRLVGPLGLDPAPLIAIEQLHASSRWSGAPDEVQRGDDEVLARWLDAGRRGDLKKLLETQNARNYTAWKYRYADRVTDLLLAAHSGGRRLIGCDMPRALRRLVATRLDRAGDVLRDLHCALALERALAETPRPAVALFVGDAHLRPDRLPRFLPALGLLWRIHLLGHRVSPDVGLEAKLGLRLTAPLLVPLGATRFALLLDGEHERIPVDRVRLAEPLAGKGNVLVQGATGNMRIAGESVDLDGAPWRTDAAAGTKVFVHTPAQGRTVAGAVELPPGGAIELDFSEGDVLRVVIHDPKAARASESHGP